MLARSSAAQEAPSSKFQTPVRTRNALPVRRLMFAASLEFGVWGLELLPQAALPERAINHEFVRFLPTTANLPFENGSVG